MELLDNKHVQDVVCYLFRLTSGLATFHKYVYLFNKCYHFDKLKHMLHTIFSEILELLKANSSLFPVEVDLSQNAFQYKSTMFLTQVFIFLLPFFT